MNRSTFYTRNTQSDRWNLRDLLENKSLEVNKEVLGAFHGIDQELECLKHDIDSMAHTCEAMKKRLDGVKQASGLAIQQAEALFNAEESTHVQLLIAETFLSHFSLSPAQIRAIKNADVNNEFFDALKRVHQIYQSCRTLLVGETQLQQRTGVDISSSMTEYMEIAYRKIYRWVRSETKFLEIYNDPEVPTLMVSAFEALQERPVLLSYCLDDIAQTRSKAVVDGFVDALTVGGPNGVPRPIDMHAHDPKRYVGDMAAFIHQALASEIELLTGGILRKVKKSALLALQGSQPTNDVSTSTTLVPSTAPLSSSHPSIQTLPSSIHTEGPSSLHSTQSEGGNGKASQLPSQSLSPGHPQLHPAHNMTAEEVSYKATLARLLNVELSGLCRPFQARVEQVFATHPSAPLLYHLANLFYYYLHIFSMHLDANNAAITRTFVECRESAYKVFFRTIGTRMTTLLQHRPPIPTADLSPTHEFAEVVMMLQDILRILDTSIIPIEDKDYEALPILDSIVDPLLEACIVGLQAANSTLRPGPRGMPVPGSASNVDFTVHSMEQVVYLINCTTSICKALERYPFCIIKLAHLKTGLDAKVNALVSEQASIALKQCGMASKLEQVYKYEVARSQHATQQQQQQLTQTGAPTSSAPPLALALMLGMDTVAIQNTLRAFETNILELGALSMVQIDKIEDDRVRTQARRATSNALADAYTTLYNAISSVDSGYTNPESLLRYKPEQVRMMIAM